MEPDTETIRALKIYEAGDKASALRHLRDLSLRHRAVSDNVLIFAVESGDLQLCQFALDIGASVNDEIKQRLFCKLLA